MNQRSQAFGGKGRACGDVFWGQHAWFFRPAGQGVRRRQHLAWREGQLVLFGPKGLDCGHFVLWLANAQGV